MIADRLEPVSWRDALRLGSIVSIWWTLTDRARFPRAGGLDLVFQEISEFRLVQADGGLPTTVAAGRAPGESGVFVFSAHLRGGGVCTENLKPD